LDVEPPSEITTAVQNCEGAIELNGFVEEEVVVLEIVRPKLQIMRLRR